MYKALLSRGVYDMWLEGYDSPTEAAEAARQVAAELSEGGLDTYLVWVYDEDTGEPVPPELWALPGSPLLTGRIA
jgi:hypothetical protein